MWSPVIVAICIQKFTANILYHGEHDSKVKAKPVSFCFANSSFCPIRSVHIQRPAPPRCSVTIFRQEYLHKIFLSAGAGKINGVIADYCQWGKLANNLFDADGPENGESDTMPVGEWVD